MNPFNRVVIQSTYHTERYSSALIQYSFKTDTGQEVICDSVPVISVLGTDVHLRYCIDMRVLAMLFILRHYKDDTILDSTELHNINGFWNCLAQYQLYDEQVDCAQVLYELQNNRLDTPVDHVISFKITGTLLPLKCYAFKEVGIVHPTATTSVALIGVEPQRSDLGAELSSTHLRLIPVLMSIATYTEDINSIMEKFEFIKLSIVAMRLIVSGRTVEHYMHGMFRSGFVSLGFSNDEYDALVRALLKTVN